MILMLLLEQLQHFRLPGAAPGFCACSGQDLALYSIQLKYMLKLLCLFIQVSLKLVTYCTFMYILLSLVYLSESMKKKPQYNFQETKSCS